MAWRISRISGAKQANNHLLLIQKKVHVHRHITKIVNTIDTLTHESVRRQSVLNGNSSKTKRIQVHYEKHIIAS